MLFQATVISGVYIIEPEPMTDERGMFARTFSDQEFAAHGLDTRIVQCALSANPASGTLRGMHYQLPPFAQARLVRCTMGAIYDVAVDLRRQSPTFKLWVAAELSAQNRRMLYVGAGCAHGFLTLADQTEVFYQMSERHHPEAERGVRWNDPAIGVSWPGWPRVIGERDANYPDMTAGDEA